MTSSTGVGPPAEVPQRVAIIGAGVIGLCCAYSLNKRGVDVVIVEKDSVGQGASSGNGGWLCPLDCAPLPEAGLTSVALKSLVDPDSPLHFKPSKLPGLVPWLLRFWVRCNDRDFQRGLGALALLGHPTFELVEAMVADGVEFELHQDGMIYATKERSSAESALETLAVMREYGYRVPDQVIVGDDLHELEPSLAPALTAGFLIEDHWHVEPESFTHGLAAALRSRGVEILEGQGVSEFVTRRGEVRAVHTENGRIEADSVILAAGAWTQKLAAQLGVWFPMEAGKGYSFLVKPTVAPRHAIMWPDMFVGCSPFRDSLRIAGTMEFSGLNTEIDRRRVEAVLQGAREGLRDLASSDIEGVWAGMRPITPDGLPVLDRADKPRNVFVATGHSMQGLHLSAATGERMAEFVLSGERPELLEPFRVDRFSRLRSRLSSKGR